MKNIAICVNPYRDAEFTVTMKIKKLLEENGIEPAVTLLFPPETPPKAELGLKISSLEEVLPDMELLICLGGDATILHTARIAASNYVPVLGINTGHMGFITDIEANEYTHILEAVNDRYTIDRRMMIDGEVWRGREKVFSGFALNDAVVSKGSMARQIDLEVLSDGHRISGFSADGIIVATPTGSTAYSFSAGGPIIDPATRNLVITPICAHALKVRPFVLDDMRRVTIRVGNLENRDAIISMDGTTPFSLMSGDEIVVTKSKYSTQLVRVLNRSFYEQLSFKLDNGI